MFHDPFSSSLKSYCLCSKLEASPFSLSVTTYISSVRYNLSSFSQTWSNLAHSNYSISFDPSSCRNNPSPRLAKNYWPISNNRWKCIGRSIFLFFCVLLAHNAFFSLFAPPSSISSSLLCLRSVSHYVTTWSTSLYFFVLSILVARDDTKTTWDKI